MELLRKLTSAFGPSGNEDEVAKIIINEINNYADEVKRDRLGNVIAVKRRFNNDSNNKKLMLAAHMDQIGVMITEIDERGYLRFTNVGYIDPYSVLYHNVVFKDGTIGVVAREEKKEIKNLKLEDLYIDIGALNREDAKVKVGIGDFGVFKSNFVADGDRVTSGALDDRIGCYVLIEAIKKIKNNISDIYFVFTVQEESYISGAATSAYAIDPDCAIVVDVTDTGDTPNGNRMALKMGEGAAIKVMDRGMICHPEVKNLLTDIVEKHGIKHQFEVLEAGKTDGSQIHVSRSGVPTGGVSIPTRYIHTPQEFIDMKDVKDAIDIIVKSAEKYK